MSTPVLSLVVADLQERARVGLRKYGDALRTFNGRNALQDAYEEALDLAMYLRQKIEEDRDRPDHADVNQTEGAEVDAELWAPDRRET